MEQSQLPTHNLSREKLLLSFHSRVNNFPFAPEAKLKKWMQHVFATLNAFHWKKIEMHIFD
jgi:hypothetical protein